MSLDISYDTYQVASVDHRIEAYSVLSKKRVLVGFAVQVSYGDSGITPEKVGMINAHASAQSNDNLFHNHTNSRKRFQHGGIS